MTSSPQSPPLEAQRFGRSQTPESPRPVHIPEPSNIPVLRNQMDPILNDTATYNIPHDQPFASFVEPIQTTTNMQNEERDAVEDFFRGAEEESSRPVNLSVPEPVAPALMTVDAPGSVQLPSNPSATDPTPSMSLSQSQVEVKNIPEQTEEAIPLTTGQWGFGEEQNTQSGIDYPSLLNNIAQSAATAPTAESLTSPTTAAPTFEQGPSISSLPAIPGLPPKPPALQHPAGFAAYQMPQPSPMSAAPIDIPVSQLDKMTASQDFVYEPAPNAAEKYPAQGYEPATGDRPWSPKTQSIYDQFLEDERGFVTEGIWDRFPAGSRLFVGNLPSEKVTKRDLFHIFHRHGKLAQISIKQAYGFIQFLQASDCHKAMEADQGVEIRGRKIHLEISKPQKNTRNANKNDRVNNNNNNARRRSRSPIRKVSNDRHGRHEFRDRRDDYRRSPSPRGYRRDDRHGGRSPRAHVSPQGYQPAYQPPFPQPYDEDAALPLPRRNPHDVPDVQLLILDQSVPQAFINWVEDGFRSKGLRASTIWLSPRLPLQAVVKRQILEGVHAIVKLLQVNSLSYKIPLQVFDRSSGATNVKFNEYVDLDMNVASDIVLHTKRTQASPSSAFPLTPTFNHAPQYGQPPIPPVQQYSPQGQTQFQPRPPLPAYPYPPPQQQFAQPQTPTPSSANSNAPNLQQLLANLQQPNGAQPANIGPGPAHSRPDLSGLLQNIAANQQNQYQAYSTQSSPQSYGTTPNSAQSYSAGGQQNNSNVQNIMAQLARYQR